MLRNGIAAHHRAKTRLLDRLCGHLPNQQSPGSAGHHRLALRQGGQLVVGAPMGRNSDQAFEHVNPITASPTISRPNSKLPGIGIECMQQAASLSRLSR